MKIFSFFLLPLVVITVCAQTKPAQNKPATPLPAGAYTGARWTIEASRLTLKERQELADLTPDFEGANATWNPTNLRWEEDPQFYNGEAIVSSRALLPMSVARAEAKRRREDAMWCDPNSGFGMSAGFFLDGRDGVRQYHCVPNDKGPEGRKGRIEENKEAEKVMEVEQERIDKLSEALTRRVLTDTEYKEVLDRGSDIYLHNLESYSQKEIDERFEHALRVQEILRKGACEKKVQDERTKEPRRG